jgi:hypothetical protein
VDSFNAIAFYLSVAGMCSIMQWRFMMGIDAFDLDMLAEEGL